MKMTLWAVTIKHLSIVPSEQTSFRFHVATKGISPKDAKRVVTNHYCADWWLDNIISDIVEIGKLDKAEGIELPEDDFD